MDLLGATIISRRVKTRNHGMVPAIVTPLHPHPHAGGAATGTGAVGATQLHSQSALGPGGFWHLWDAAVAVVSPTHGGPASASHPASALTPAPPTVSSLMHKPAGSFPQGSRSA